VPDKGVEVQVLLSDTTNLDLPHNSLTRTGGAFFVRRRVGLMLEAARRPSQSACASSEDPICDPQGEVEAEPACDSAARQ
jgi:hypothetical protein